MSMIELRDFCFKYFESEKMVIDHIDMEIQPGEWVLITGKSGCGKTTLALAIAGFLLHPPRGEFDGAVLIKGKKINHMPLYEIASEVYLVQQNPENQFCTLTVIDEIAFGLENRLVDGEEILSRIETALKAVNGSELRNRNLLELSGGEQQKVAIATALAMQPDVLILDEPTSNLDPESSAHLFSILADLREHENLTVLVIEHRVNQLESLFSKWYQFDDGTLKPISRKNTYEFGRTFIDKNRRFEYFKGEPILDLKSYRVIRDKKEIINLDRFVVQQGEFISLMGPNGSGKTSFLLSLPGFVKSAGVKRMIANHEIGREKPQEIARDVGLVFQNPDHQIFCDSVNSEYEYAENNYFPETQIDQSWKDYLLERFGLKELISQHPFLLSFGQKSRLNLASVMAYQPKLLLLDEIFIGQDPENVKLMLDSLREYIATFKASVILVNHQMTISCQYADRVVFFDEGKILFDEPTEISIQMLHQVNRTAYLV